MGVLWLLTLLLIVPLLCFLVFLALSSCLGDGFRARVSGFSINPRHGSYDQTYFRTMTNPGPGSSEHIELETMLNSNERDRDVGDDNEY